MLKIKYSGLESIMPIVMKEIDDNDFRKMMLEKKERTDVSQQFQVRFLALAIGIIATFLILSAA